jgi:hypothetical protein
MWDKYTSKQIRSLWALVNLLLLSMSCNQLAKITATPHVWYYKLEATWMIHTKQNRKTDNVRSGVWYFCHGNKKNHFVLPDQLSFACLALVMTMQIQKYHINIIVFSFIFKMCSLQFYLKVWNPSRCHWDPQQWKQESVPLCYNII